jgi:hypothetical protein
MANERGSAEWRRHYGFAGRRGRTAVLDPFDPLDDGDAPNRPAIDHRDDDDWQAFVAFTPVRLDVEPPSHTMPDPRHVVVWPEMTLPRGHK